MTGVIRINGVSISVPTYIVKQCQSSEESDFETKVFLDQVREATKKVNLEDMSGAELYEKLSADQLADLFEALVNSIDTNMLEKLASELENLVSKL